MRSPLGSRTRRLLAGSLALVLAVNVGVVVLGAGVRGDEAPAAGALRPLGPAEPFDELAPPPRPMVEAPEPPPPPPPPPPPARPARPPANEYAEEPHIVIGQIQIPKLGLDVALNQGISLRSIDRGPSHWPGTALPGHAGNVVVAGHRVTKTRPFRNIDQLAPGDEIIFTVEGVRSVYRVTHHEVVTPKDLWIVDPTPTPTATLFACHPPGSARYRYVVRAELV